MEVKFINPFLESLNIVMPQLGVTNIKKNKIYLRDKAISSNAEVVAIVGLIGDYKGTVMYSISTECALHIASIMIGTKVDELDEISQSAISELANMLTANAATICSTEGINMDISAPTLIYGDFKTYTKSQPIVCIDMSIDDLPFEVNICID